MNRKQWIVAGIIVVFIVVGPIFLSARRSASPVATGQTSSVLELAYCGDEPIKPCIVSFGVDAFNNMLINLLLPDQSFPTFYLKVARAGVETTYACQRVSAAVNGAYCAGPKLPPGEILHLMLISTRDETLLAQGDLSIIGLAFPTLGIAASTPQETLTTLLTESPTPTFLSQFILPTPTETLSSYPNPSYPNPSYP